MVRRIFLSGLVRTVLVSALVSGVALMAGCDAPGLTTKGAKSAALAKHEPVGKATTTAAKMGAPATGTSGPGILTSGLSVSDAIAQACGIAPRTEGPTSSPSFEFDSASLGDDDRKMLGDVAKCLTEGALRGRSVRLTGRADVRGEDEYNMSLGGSRSDAVRRYLQDLGVGKDHLDATSRGEMDATGTDEAGYERDRRVDIQLLEPSTNP